jgi:hypothetical protein
LRPEAVDRGDIDDGACALLHHLANLVLHAEEDTLDVDGEIELAVIGDDGCHHGFNFARPMPLPVTRPTLPS